MLYLMFHTWEDNSRETYICYPTNILNIGLLLLYATIPWVQLEGRVHQK